MSQLSYPINQPAANEGQRADAGAVDVLSMVHQDIPQIGTLTVGGTPADGTYSTTITLPSGAMILVETIRATTPATNADLAAQHAIDLNATEALNGVVEAVDAAAVITLTFKDAGVVYPVATAAPGSGTLVHVVTQAADSTNPLPIGKFVARLTGTDRTVKVLASGDVVADIFGLVERPIGQIENTGNGNADLTALEFPVPSMIPAGRKGRWMVRTEEAVSPDSTPFIRMLATGTEVAGSLRATTDGGDALDASSIVSILGTAAAGELVKIEVHIV